MTKKRFDVVYEEDDEYKNIRYWEIIDTKSQNSTSNELEIVKLLNELDDEIKELEIEYRRLARFLMKNGYTISDYLDYCEENEFK